jgi:hypothetical protein
MSPLEPLAPDQRAVVALVLQQGRSYGEIAALLGIPTEAVRGRAHAGLAALAPGNGLPGEVTAPLADYLLGQQPPADADATRGLLAESAPARDWATGVAARLADVAPGPLPEIPDAGSEPSPATPPPAERDAAPRPSRLGGLALIAGVLAVVGLVLFLVLRGGSGGEEPAASGAAAPAAGATATPAPAELQVADTIPLRAAAGGRASGTMTVYLQGTDQLLFELQARDVPPGGDDGAYAVWLTGPGTRARRLGFADRVGQDGVLGIQGPSERDLARFPRLYATYENVVVSRETTGDARRPSEVVLTGTLPRGR